MKAIQFTKAWQVDYINTSKQPKGSTIIKTLFSIISAGTEMAILSGNESWAPLPYIPGYGSVGRVIEDENGTFSPGDLVFTYGSHTEFSKTDTVTVKLSENIKLEQAVFARMAAVSITSIRCSNIELGDKVVVIGAGIVGNFAAQLAKLSGANVSIVDPNEKRCLIAKECGIKSTYSNLDEIDDNIKFSTVIDATGVPSVILNAANLVDDKGEFILLGSPRGKFKADVTPFLNKVHLCPTNMNLKGAHEWRYPVLKKDAPMQKHSIERNIEIILNLIESKQLLIEPMVTDIITPPQATTIYNKLREKDNSSLGIIINWEE
ncbi:MAG: zinc-binding alcohol dehydrogenase [Sphaerochaetaceae bacterium]|nr:zinc-binding alcohol dehydrogenase [Sphaerochaetaceae bacterium]